MSPADFRKWIAIGTGAGIEIGSEDLNITVARVRPGGVQILGSLNILKYREQPAASWGATYADFLRKLGGSYLTATVMLPRHDVIVRQISLPGVLNRDVPAALNFQIDSLHPYAENEAAYAWARIGKTSTILVGITRRDVLDSYIALFNEAGIKVSSFTFSGACMYSAIRLYAPPAAGFVALSPQQRNGEEEFFEVYGESPTHPLFSASLEMPEQRVRTLALSELRLEPDSESTTFDAILPKPLAAPEGEDIARLPMPYATALTGACPRLGLAINLLPEEQRAARSRWMYIPTIVLASLLLLAMGGLALNGNYENRRYVETLEHQIKLAQPQAAKATALDRDITTLRNRAQMLDTFRLRSKDDMDALNDLTRVLPPPTWLNGLQLSRTQVSISGQTDQSTPLLKALDGTKQFKRSEFTLPMARVPLGETFSIRASREGVSP
jgi:Tfp pilus assembly protein PilN